MSKNPTPVTPLQALSGIAAERSIIRRMRFAEKLVLGLWVGFLAANIAIFASALPYIYTQEAPMKCGSLGITNFVFNMIPQSILAIIMLAIFFYSGRACISAGIRLKHVPIVKWIAKAVVFGGVIIWVSCALSGAGTFASFLMMFMNILRNPPPLPPNQSDVKACSEFILNTKPSDYYDPLLDINDWLKRYTG
jgi:hypothetical protein